MILNANKVVNSLRMSLNPVLRNINSIASKPQQEDWYSEITDIQTIDLFNQLGKPVCR